MQPAATPGNPRAAASPINRRNALRRLAGGGAATALGAASWGHGAASARPPEPPGSTPSPPLAAALGTPPPPLPDAALRVRDAEAYWTRVRREQFLLPDDRAFLNPGSLGVMPRPVLNAVFESVARGAEYATDTVPRWGYESLEPERAEMAAFLGCAPEEIAFTHNCTEAMSFIAAGLDLKPGDEVLTTNQEHGSGISCWRVKAARVGVVVREVEIPVAPRDPSELLERLVGAIGPRTRVLSRADSVGREVIAKQMLPQAEE